MKGYGAGAGALLLVVVALGCAGGEAESVRQATSVQTATVVAPPFRAQDALISLPDLPPGWAMEPADQEKGADFCGQGEGAASLVAVQSVDKAEAQYAEGGGIPLLAHAVGVYSEGGAETAFARLRDLLDSCSSFESDGTTFTVAPVSFAEVGDESVPLLLQAEVDGFNVSFYYVIFRVGDGIAIVGYGGLAPDVGEMEKFTGLAAQKLTEAQTP
ncbi:MAG: hypothetical protein R2878_02685 [Thermoleophilia bacterium]